jgi:hypothetical protein
MRTVWIKVELPDEQAAILESPTGLAMVIPMLAGEVVPFGVKVNRIAEAIEFFKRSLSTLRQLLESGGDKEGRIGKTLEQMMPAVSDAAIIMDDLRVVIGSAIFVGQDDKPEVRKQ